MQDELEKNLKPILASIIPLSTFDNLSALSMRQLIQLAQRCTVNLPRYVQILLSLLFNDVTRRNRQQAMANNYINNLLKYNNIIITVLSQVNLFLMVIIFV